MQMRHVEIVYSVKTKSTENWICVWLEVASIFLSLVFEKKKRKKKKKEMAGKEAFQDDQVQVCFQYFNCVLRQNFQVTHWDRLLR